MFTLVGVECGFHRYASHKAFQCNKLVHDLLLIAGSMALQGPVLFWVATHRKHHAFEDGCDDPHTPRARGLGALSAFRGFLNGHFIWLLKRQNVDLSRFSADLIKDERFYRIHVHYARYGFLGLILPAFLGLIYYQSFMGLWQGFLWGGLIRIFCVHHAVWSVNSLCHLFGEKKFSTKGHSGNLAWLTFFTLGGSLHNNHHAFPTTAHNALGDREVDPIGSMLFWLEKFGWVWDRKIPSKEVINRKLIDRPVCPAS